MDDANRRPTSRAVALKITIGIVTDEDRQAVQEVLAHLGDSTHYVDRVAIAYRPAVRCARQ